MMLPVSLKNIENNDMYKPLSFDYESINGTPLISAKALGLGAFDTGMLNCDEVCLTFDGGSISISVDDDTDQLILSAGVCCVGSKWVDIEELGGLRGKEVGWCWVGRNYLNFSDVFIISFDGIAPQLLFYAMGSSICLYRVKPMVAVDGSPPNLSRETGQ